MVNVYAFVALLAATVAAALAFGGPPERWMAALVLAAAAASHAAYSDPVDRFVSVEWAVAAVDLALLVAIGVLMAHADRFWPIAMFAAHGATVLAHGVRFVDGDVARRAYAIALAAPSYLTLLVLLAGVLRHRMRRRRNGCDVAWSRAAGLGGRP